MADPKEWFWTPVQLEQLRRVLDTIAQRDAEGSYFGPVGLESYVAAYNREHDLGIPRPQITRGLSILVFLEILAPGATGGNRPKDYKRRYHVERPSVTGADVQRFRRSQSKVR